MAKTKKLSLDSITQPSWNHAFINVNFNNQDSVLMSMFVPDFNQLCLLHDNRIFAFKKRGYDFDSSISSTSSIEQNLIMNMLTTPKYRALGFMYLIFRLLDNLNFLLIIILSIYNMEFTMPKPGEVALLSAIGLEFFYDVILYTHKYWILQRLSIHIGIVMYIVYSSIVAWKYQHGDYDRSELDVVIAVLSMRFAAFIFEECVDIAIDAELHNDLLMLHEAKDSVNHDLEMSPMDTPEPVEDSQIESNYYLSLINSISTNISSLFSLSGIRKYFDISRTVQMPYEIEYIGSFFAWSSTSVLTKDVWRREPFPRCFSYILCLIPSLVSVFLLFWVLLLCIAASLIPVLLSPLLYIICAVYFCTFSPAKLWENFRNFYKEITYF